MSGMRDREHIAKELKADRHWRVIVRPCEFEHALVATINECEDIVASCQVNWADWPYPYMDSRAVYHGDDRISCSLYWEEYSYREYWNYYRSGQYLHLCDFQEKFLKDGGQQYSGEPLPTYRQGLQPKGYLGLTSALRRITEIFEFAARLAQKNALGQKAEIAIQLLNAEGTLLIEPYRPVLECYQIRTNGLATRWSGTTQELVSSSAELALDASTDLLGGFESDRGYLKVQRSLLVDRQRELLKR